MSRALNRHYREREAGKLRKLSIAILGQEPEPNKAPRFARPCRCSYCAPKRHTSGPTLGELRFACVELEIV